MLGKDRIRAKLKQENTSIRILLSHPMHTGRGKNEQGVLIAEHFIQAIDCWRNGKVVMHMDCGRGVARNPYLSFQLKGGVIGDAISVKWTDNLGNVGHSEAKVK